MIQFFHVYKRYGDSSALHDINLEIDKGEAIFLSGPSGAGKSTLLKLIFAAEVPSQGQILVNGMNISRIHAKRIPRLRRQVGVVFQDFKLLENRSVFENVAFRLEVEGQSRAMIRQRVRSILRQVGLEHKLNSYPLRLSGGEQQRVAIARAVVNEPRILLADEPTGNLDSVRTEEIIQLLKQFHSRGMTLIVATHDMDLVERVGWRHIRIEGGRLLSQVS